MVNLDALSQFYVFVFLIFPSLCVALRKIAPPFLGPRSCADDQTFLAKKRQDSPDCAFRDVMAMLALYHHCDFGLAPTPYGRVGWQEQAAFRAPPSGGLLRRLGALEGGRTPRASTLRRTRRL